MKLSLALAALYAIPALAGLDYSESDRKEFKETIYFEEESDHRPRPHHPHQPHKPDGYKPHHPAPHKPEEHRPHKPEDKEHDKEHDKDHDKPEKHGKVKLTEKEVCRKLKSFAHQADKIHDKVNALKCGKDYNRCWLPIKKEIYELEFELDFFDIAIDKSGINKCWSSRQEGEIACCYKTYANALIRLLKLINEKSKHLEGEADKYIITAINSIKAADYTFVYELVRRIQSEEYAKEIMKKQGAKDGSTPNSIREAFALFVSTPYITGDNFQKGKHE